MPYISFINLREEDFLIKSPKEIIKGDTIGAGPEVAIGYKRYLSHYQCLMVLAIIKKHVTICIMTQKVLRNKAIRASRRDRIGTSGLSLSVLPIRCPVARAQIFSRLFNCLLQFSCFFSPGSQTYQRGKS
jgi:hypothetical protein